MGDVKVIPFKRGRGRPVEPAILTAENIVVARGGVNFLDEVSFALSPGGITALLGPNGAGKSLILKTLSGLLAPDSGTITLNPDLRGNVALVFQTPVLLRRSVRANLAHALKIYGVPKPAREGRIAELLVLADLTDQAVTPARALSGGEKQRLAMARALASDPKLLLLDEPTASLDPRSTGQIERLTRRAADDGAKVILVTHDCGQAERLADDVLFLHRGKIREHAPAQTFFSNPTSEPARVYLGGSLLL